jgi:hypothetical protein
VVDELKKLAWEATVGLIPFVQTERMYVSMPLKAFEYVASGLPVVSTPVKALEEHEALFEIACTPEKYAAAMQRAAKTRWDAAAVDTRRKIAKQFDYDQRYTEFLNWLDRFDATHAMGSQSCNILVLYDANSTHVSAIHEHLLSFSLYSRHHVCYAAAAGITTPAADLSLFDVVVMHYSIRVSLEDHLSPANCRALREFPGLKILFIQDEYDTTETARCAIENLGVHVVFTCVPKEYIKQVYTPARFP